MIKPMQAGGKPGYSNTDEQEVPNRTDTPKEFPDKRGDDPDSRVPERA
jgi:hypothetical protein